MATARHFLGVFTTTAALSAAPVFAQDVVTPPIEVTAMATAILPVSFDGGAFGVIAGGASITCNVHRRVGIEVIGEALAPNFSSAGLSGIYQVQGRFSAAESADGARTMFVTIGFAGSFYTERHDEFRRQRPDGSIVVTPGFRHGEIDAPRLLSTGLAHRRVLASRVSLMLAAQVLFSEGGIAPRASVGVTFGARRYR